MEPVTQSVPPRKWITEDDLIAAGLTVDEVVRLSTVREEHLLAEQCFSEQELGRIRLMRWMHEQERLVDADLDRC